MSEGLKMLSLFGIFGLILLGLAAYTCGHGACHAPDTWDPILSLAGLR